MLTEYEKVESIIFTIITQFALIYQLIKLLLISKGYSNYYVASIYSTTVMLHLILFSSYYQFFDNFKRFNFIFAAQYTIITLLNLEKYLLIPCIIHSIIATYPNSRDLECIVIILSNIIYSIVLAQALAPLVNILVSNEDEVAFLIGFIVIGIVTVVLGLVALISQLKEVKLRDINDQNTFEGNDIEEGRGIQSQDKDTRINNYLALNN